ncbi:MULTISPECIES: YutD family protein [Lactobacillus]|uniref:DUF1027 domain-containing protein n=1 Tax=Lactobacillus xujianguonis TaxID=2495899 RepID=A0A437SSI3_9LACO|nr:MULTISPECIES: YutD family protein [Lactobacillus]RVU69868.1 DUF1027 domain-containing protein [Lactobacillus xujianguonis]RVU72044.1 DUF1027 domain-containing protein [Lactobacillus xujianguonis]
MSEEKENNKENRFEKKQPLRHPLAVVAQNEDKVKINKQLYRIAVNEGDALDLEVLRRKYDPYLDQYDFLVGDVSSEHLRLKGFYKDIVRTAIDRKEKAIADYLIEYCNPGTAYFVLELISPVHNYQNRDNKHNNFRHKRKYNANHHKNNFKKRRVHKAKFPKRKVIAVQKGRGHKHAFVIKKKEEQSN